jgi:hypothetical protein
MGFTFNRAGVRIATLAASAWIPERTVITDEHRATSLLATMRERWNLGAPFTAREASAPSFANIFTLDSPRAQEDWPEIVPRPVPEMPEAVVPLDAPLGLLGRSLLFSVLALAQGRGLAVPDIKQDDPVTGAQAVAIAHELMGDLSPTCATRRRRADPDPAAPVPLAAALARNGHSALAYASLSVWATSIADVWLLLGLERGPVRERGCAPASVC